MNNRLGSINNSSLAMEDSEQQISQGNIEHARLSGQQQEYSDVELAIRSSANVSPIKS